MPEVLPGTFWWGISPKKSKIIMAGQAAYITSRFWDHIKKITAIGIEPQESCRSWTMFAKATEPGFMERIYWSLVWRT
jgi:hypothetical protein